MEFCVFCSLFLRLTILNDFWKILYPLSVVFAVTIEINFPYVVTKKISSNQSIGTDFRISASNELFGTGEWLFLYPDKSNITDNWIIFVNISKTIKYDDNVLS